MPVTLFTGLPGSGKTARLVAEIHRLRKDEPDRPIFQMGINGLREGLANTLTMEQLRKWDTELPPGAIICLDECQEPHLFPLDKGLPADWVKAISKVRHHGVDFLLTTQHPTLMSAYVRRLVDKHVHMERKFNTQVVDRVTWQRCMDAPEKPGQQKVGQRELGTLPKEVFDDYKSAQLHNMKRKLPRKFWMFLFFVVVAAVGVPAAFYMVFHMKDKAVAAQTTGASTGDVHAPSQQSPASVNDTMRREDFAKWQRPRVDGVPWTAPMFDALPVAAVPKLFCMAMDDGRCTCHTEQGTRYAMKVEMCRQIVADGLYNPFQAPEQDDRRREPPTASQAGRTPQAPEPGWTAGAMPAGGARGRATATAYKPPTYGAWNPDPFGGSSKK